MVGPPPPARTRSSPETKPAPVSSPATPRAEAVAQMTGRDLGGGVRDEERGREQADRGERHTVGVRERVGGGADARHVPGRREADPDGGRD
jgi:hypothetical protein